MPPCLRKFCVCWATKCWILRPFLKSKSISLYDFWDCMPLCLWNLQGNYFLSFFAHWCGRFYTGILHAWRYFVFIRDILHAWRESRRNSIQAGDYPSMRESWKPCHISIHNTWAVQNLKRGIYKTPWAILAKIQISPERVLPSHGAWIVQWRSEWPLINHWSLHTG